MSLAILKKSALHNIIGFNLCQEDVDFTFGALRNVQLAATFFPEWKVKLFIPRGYQNKSNSTAASTGTVTTSKIISKIETLGAHVVYVHNAQQPKIPCDLWNIAFLAEDPKVDNFLIRDVRSRLSNRDAASVNEWMESRQTMHCIHDLAQHQKVPIVPGLWGVSRIKLKNVVSMAKLIKVLTLYCFKTLNIGIKMY